MSEDAHPPTADSTSFTRRTALTGGGAALAAALLAACGGDHHATAKTVTTPSDQLSDTFGTQPALKFTFINHATSSAVFAATQNGAADACKLLDCKYTWTGSANSNVSQMLSALDSAVISGSDGIAISLIDYKAFDVPVQSALRAGIPVVSYNADAPGSGRLAYVGQDLVQSGHEFGRRIADLLPSGGKVGILLATPETANLQPRLEGALSALSALRSTRIEAQTFATGAMQSGAPQVVSHVLATHSDYVGFFALDGDSTTALGQAIKSATATASFRAGGFDMTPANIGFVAGGQLSFLIDQQPYLQGFLPILQLYLHRVSRGLTGPADVDTGIRFHDRRTIGPFTSTRSRFEGSSSSAGVQQA